MRDNTPIPDGLLPSGNTFKNANSFLLCVIAVYINKIRSWSPMFGNENGIAIFLKLCNEPCCLSF